MKSLFALFGAAVLLSFSGCAVMPVYPEVAGLTFLHGELVARLGGSLYEVAEGVRGRHNVRVPSDLVSSADEALKPLLVGVRRRWHSGPVFIQATRLDAGFARRAGLLRRPIHVRS